MTRQASPETARFDLNVALVDSLDDAILSIDGEGLIVIANRQADSLLTSGGAGALLGSNARDCLPEAWVALAEEAAGESHTVMLADGRRFHVMCHRMGDMCKAQGCILVFSPV